MSGRINEKDLKAAFDAENIVVAKILKQPSKDSALVFVEDGKAVFISFEGQRCMHISADKIVDVARSDE